MLDGCPPWPPPPSPPAPSRKGAGAPQDKGDPGRRTGRASCMARGQGCKANICQCLASHQGERCRGQAVRDCGRLVLSSLLFFILLIFYHQQGLLFREKETFQKRDGTKQAPGMAGVPCHLWQNLECPGLGGALNRADEGSGLSCEAPGPVSRAVTCRLGLAGPSEDSINVCSPPRPNPGSPAGGMRVDSSLCALCGVRDGVALCSGLKCSSWLS